MTKAKTNKIKSKEVLKTKNESWGFYGTTMTDYSSTEQAEKRWAEAFITLSELSKMDPERIRRFLDSRAGRHMADACYDLNKSVADKTKELWQNSWFRREVFHKAYTASDEKFYK